MPENLNNLKEVSSGVKSDGKICGIRELLSITDPIGDDEYRIALRVGSAEVKSMSTGEPVQVNDYHFMRQDADGSWSHKPGSQPVQYLPDGETPETVSWDLLYKDGTVAYQGFYDSEIKYFAVEYNKR